MTIVNVPTYTVAQLGEMSASKQELFRDHEGPFDFALPQRWLDGFATWCREQGAEHLTYGLILYTTVWDYSHQRTVGIPLSACREVAEAIRDYMAR